MGTSDYLDIDNWPSEDEINNFDADKIASIWKLLQCQDKLVLTVEIANRYKVIQRRYISLTGHSLPDTIKGAIKTRAQARDEIGVIDESKVEKAVQGGLMAKLKKMREGK